MRTYGPTTSRFDHHPPPPHDHGPDGPAIAYWAAGGHLTPSPSDALAASLAEVFAVNRTIELSRHAPRFVIAEMTRDLRLLDVSDTNWVVRQHGNAALSSGDRSIARDWAQLIHATYPDVDGIWYQTSNCPPARSLALNERSADALPSTPEGSWALNDPSIRHLIDAAADSIEYQVV